MSVNKIYWTSSLEEWHIKWRQIETVKLSRVGEVIETLDAHCGENFYVVVTLSPQGEREKS